MREIAGNELIVVGDEFSKSHGLANLPVLPPVVDCAGGKRIRDPGGKSSDPLFVCPYLTAALSFRVYSERKKIGDETSPEPGMKLRWKILAGLTVVAACTVMLFRPDHRERDALEQTRRELRAQGFKTDLADFNLSIPPELRARAATLTNTDPRWSNTKNPGESLHFFLAQNGPNLMKEVGSNAALVIWREAKLADVEPAALARWRTRPTILKMIFGPRYAKPRRRGRRPWTRRARRRFPDRFVSNSMPAGGGPCCCRILPP